MLRSLTCATAMTLLAAGAALAHGEDEHHHHEHSENVTEYRLFVGDHDKGQITAFNLDEPDEKWTFDTKGQPKLYSEADGAVIVAVQSFDDQVSFLSSGISLHSHGDHQDIEISDPKLAEPVIDGKRPFHVIANDGKISVNFDREGYAMLVDAHGVTEGKVEPVKFTENHAHHGIVVPMGDLYIASVASDEAPAKADELPGRVGAQAFTPDGQAVGDVQTCTGLHGEALSGAYLALGCKEGVLTVTRNGGDAVFTMLDYPADYPEGDMSSTILGSKAVQMFVAKHGKQAISIIDPTDEPHMRLVNLPFRIVDYVLDPIHPSYALALTEDGTLHQIDLLKAEVASSAKVTDAYSMDGDWNDPRPRLAMAGEELVMTDPKAAVVRRISSETLKELGTIPVEGVPYNIAVAGGSGVVH